MRARRLVSEDRASKGSALASVALSGVALASVALSGVALTGCDWTAFDDFEEGAPVIRLEKPKGAGSAFGNNVAVVDNGDRVLGMVAAAPGGNKVFIYELGDGQKPSDSVLLTLRCDEQPDTECRTVDQVASMRSVNVAGRDADLCFAYAIGVGPLGGERGILGRCDDSLAFTLQLPEGGDEIQTEFEESEQNQPIVLDADPGDLPVLVAGASNQDLAWFYASGDNQAVSLTPPTSFGENDDYGTAVKVLSSEDDEDSRLFAVSAPGAGQLWLFNYDGSEVNPVACLGGSEGFGRALGRGDVDGDGIEELVVSDESTVHVLSGQALFGLPPIPAGVDVSCSLLSLPEGALLASFGCGSRDGVEGCDESDFGAALSVADLDGDEDGEVIVGAPTMTVRGESNAGALLVYDIEGDADDEEEGRNSLSEVLFMSSAEKGDRLGAALATTPQSGRDAIIAGAPGTSKVAIFYCSELAKGRADRLGDDLGSRCK